MTLDASQGNPSIVDPVAAAAKPVPGQVESARLIRAFLAGSGRWSDDQLSVQDPLSIRVAPQVHGAFREFASFLRAAVETELSAMDDNPLVVVGERRMISNGNFHPIAMALALDALRPAIAHVGQLSDRRMNHLWTILLGRIDMTSPESILDAVRAERPDAALRGRDQGRRASRDGRARDARHRSARPRRRGPRHERGHARPAVPAEALERLEDVLAIELVMAWQTAASSPAPLALGSGTRAALRALEAAVPSRRGPRPTGSMAPSERRSMTRSWRDALAAVRRLSGSRRQPPRA